MWVIESKDGELLKKFDLREEAEDHYDRLGHAFREIYRIAHRSNNQYVDRILTEGLVKNDLEGILLPRVSIDEYVPADPNTDNVVLAFFIKGVPEAVVPFRNFVYYCDGVVDVDYGDSDTIPNTSIVYTEMDRESVEIKEITDMMEMISMLTNLEVGDFTMTFPHTDKKFPFNEEILKRYFTSRNERKNRLAQKRAQEEAEKEEEEQIAQFKQDQEQDQPEEETT